MAAIPERIGCCFLGVRRAELVRDVLQQARFAGSPAVLDTDGACVEVPRPAVTYCRCTISLTGTLLMHVMSMLS